jgi:hypothetical protein
MLKEMANPTGLLVEVMPATTEPVDRELKSTIRELIGQGASEYLIGFCFMSLITLCFGAMMLLRTINKDNTRIQPSSAIPADLGVEKLADDIIRFAMAGIRSFRETSG